MSCLFTNLLGKSCCPQGAECDMINMRCNYEHINPTYDLGYDIGHDLGHDIGHDLGHDLVEDEDLVSADYDPITSILDNATLLSDCPSPNPCQSKQTCCVDDHGGTCQIKKNNLIIGFFY